LARRLKIELAEDEAGVRIDVTTPKRILSPSGRPSRSRAPRLLPTEAVEPGTLEQLASILLGWVASTGADSWSTGSRFLWPVAWYD
jgi:hypothetical protein